MKHPVPRQDSHAFLAFRSLGTDRNDQSVISQV